MQNNKTMAAPEGPPPEPPPSTTTTTLNVALFLDDAEELQAVVRAMSK